MKKLIICTLFILVPISNFAMVQLGLYLSDWGKRPTKDKVVEKIMQDRELGMKKIIWVESGASLMDGSFNDVAWRIRLIKDEGNPQIQTIITCTDQEVLEKVNKLLLQQKS